MKKYHLSLIFVVILLFITIPVVSAEKQNLAASEFPIPALKFKDTGSAVTIHHGFTINPANKVTSQAVQVVTEHSVENIQLSENGFSVPVGSLIYHTDNTTTRIFDSEGEQQIIISDTGSSAIATPEGNLPATRIYQVPSGSVISENGNVTQVSLNGERILTVIDQKYISPKKNDPVIPTYNGWIEASSVKVSNIAQFIAYWKVPCSPPSPQSNTVNFLFNAIEPATGTAIIQPVLEWNQMGSGRWTGRSWSYGPSGAYYSVPIYVVSGHTIEGTLSWDKNIGLWNITTADQQTGQSVTIFSSNQPEIATTNLYAFCSLEGYGVLDNTDVPGSTTFYNMRIKDTNNLPVVFSWKPTIYAQNTLTGLNVSVTSQSMVTLQTANPGLPPAISGVDPLTEKNNIPDLNVSISGTNFWGKPVVKLVQANHPDIIGNSVTVVSPSEIYGLFNLSGTAAGNYNLVVVNPDGLQVQASGFIVKPSISPSLITIASPNGGETWQRGTSHTVTWNYTGDPGSAVKIVLLKGTSVVGTIKDSTSIGSGGKGSYTWAMSTSGTTTGSDIRIRVQSISQPTINDTSNNYFTITAPLVAPVANFTGSIISGSAPLNVQYTSSSTGPVTMYSWDFTNDGITDSTAEKPNYTYSTPGTYSVKLTVTGPGGSHSKVRSNYITVSSPTITVTSPNGGETWQRGTSHTVTWNYAGDPGSTVKIVLLKGTSVAGTIKDSISVGSGGKGSYTWAMSSSGTTTGSDIRIRVQSISQPTINDTSNNYFTITAPLVAPLANFTGNMIYGSAPLTVTFTDTSTNSPTAWSWSFGDGDTTNTTLKNPVHTYRTAGPYTVTLTATNVAGSNTIEKKGYIRMLIPIPGYNQSPTDPDHDGIYEDLNGNGRLDFADYVLFFNQMEWISAHEPVSLFDFNGNGRIDFSDLVKLYGEI